MDSSYDTKIQGETKNAVHCGSGTEKKRIFLKRLLWTVIKKLGGRDGTTSENTVMANQENEKLLEFVKRYLLDPRRSLGDIIALIRGIKKTFKVDHLAVFHYLLRKEWERMFPYSEFACKRGCKNLSCEYIFICKICGKILHGNRLFRFFTKRQVKKSVTRTDRACRECTGSCRNWVNPVRLLKKGTWVCDACEYNGDPPFTGSKPCPKHYLGCA